MAIFSHVRFRFWDGERYTDAQAAELRQLRALYTTHLVPVFGAALPDAFALRTEGEDHYPRYIASTLMPPPITPIPPSPTLPTQPYKSFADTLIATLAVFEENRQQRWYGKGHPNDPTRLFGTFLRNLCQNWLTHAPTSEITLRQVTALRQYVEALARQHVFTNEGQGHDGMVVLLHNLATPLSLLEKRLTHELSLQSAREHFSEIKAGVSQALSEAAAYLFCALAGQDRTKLPFSLVNLQAKVVNKQLTQALATREGLLLRQWVHSPGVTESLLPQKEAKDVSLQAHQPISLFGSATPTPLLDEKGSAQPDWLGFLQGSESVQAQLTPALKALPSGICPLLLEAKASPPLLQEAIALHGLLETLAGYQGYLHQCWQLAGFAGDYCVYDHMAEAISAILTELLTFNQILAERLGHFQARLDERYKEALDKTAYLEWQANYRQAKAAQEKLLGILKGAEAALKKMVSHSADRVGRMQRRQLATKAYETLQAAPRFLNQARRQVGLAPKADYPGLAAPKAKAALSDPFSLSLAPETMTLDQILVTLFPERPRTTAWLSRLCAETSITPPWRIFRGSYQRYAYLHNNMRLQRIAQDFTRLQLHAELPMTLEKSAFIEQLRRQLQEEHARIARLSEGLWWPFHRASIRFFNTLQHALHQKLRYLAQLPAATPPNLEVGVSTHQLQARLMPAGSALTVLSEPLSEADRKSLAAIYQEYAALLPEERVSFDTWQREQFGELLWDAQGKLCFLLTKRDATLISTVWARCMVQYSQSVLATHQLLHERVELYLNPQPAMR